MSDAQMRHVAQQFVSFNARGEVFMTFARFFELAKTAGADNADDLVYHKKLFQVRRCPVIRSADATRALLPARHILQGWRAFLAGFRRRHGQ